MNYTQCKLRKEIGNQASEDMRWIPSKYAKTNSFLKIKRNGNWENGWRVEKTGAIMDEKDLFPDEYRDHRKITDI